MSADSYRPELLARIARLSMSMNEPAEAGRYWLLSGAAGPQVEAAVEAFVESCQRSPQLIAKELPRFLRDWDLEVYPPLVLERIERYGLAEHLARRRRAERPRLNSSQLVFLCAVLALLIGAALAWALRR